MLLIAYNGSFELMLLEGQHLYVVLSPRACMEAVLVAIMRMILIASSKLSKTAVAYNSAVPYTR